MNKKKLIIISGISLGIIIIISSIIIFCKYNQKIANIMSPNPELKYNTNQDFLKDKEANGLTFTNIECFYDGEISTIKYIIMNKSKQNIHLGAHEITIKDKNGDILTTINPNYDYDLKPEEEFPSSNTVNIDLTNAYTMELNLDNMNQTTTSK